MMGTGYVGLVTGTCFADSGNDVTCVDINAQKIAMLKDGDVPIYEPGLTEMIQHNAEQGRLKFTTDVSTCVPDAKCIFLAVGTPQGDDGSANLSYLFSAADAIAPYLRPDAVVIVKSTVPVGTNRKIANRLRELTGRTVDVASNPEFLKEGCAIDDFTKPDRVVVGCDREDVADVVHDLYKPFLRTEKPYLVMGLESAEMTKYVANCLLATKISFINEMANLCERVGADINEVRRGIGHDQRIGFAFLFPGVGYGGSCFPKDVRALSSVAAEKGMRMQMLEAVDEINNRQKNVLFEKITARFGASLKGKKIAVWGLAFKPRTDDIREAPALVLLEQLIEAGAEVHVHDPVAMENVQKEIGDKVRYHEHHYDTLEGADAMAIVTEWNEYRNPDFAYIKHKLKAPVIFDGRNLYDPSRMAKEGITYLGVGLSSEKK
ncbi:UDP-glucose 6-dehydrogenase TuaD [Planctomyces sp. SH-PL14]|nr:UDP-glucose 6-dehydrogenase TuaD [Planctomyces sp. SH-PL14]